MTDTIKEKSFYETQKYIATQEWLDIKAELDLKIDTLKDYILEDAILPQPITLSKNMLRWRGKELALQYIAKINCEHLKWMLMMCIVKDNEERIMTPYEVSCDKLEFSEKDWSRREIRILRYIALFSKIYWQEEKENDNGTVEAWLNSLTQGIFI